MQFTAKSRRSRVLRHILLVSITFSSEGNISTEIMEGAPFSMPTSPCFTSLSSSLFPAKDCCVCNSTAKILGPKQNTICGSCLENAKRILTLSQMLADENFSDEAADINRAKGHYSPNTKGLERAFNQIKEFRDALLEKLRFVEALTVAFREGIEPDVELVPSDGPSIHVHRVVLTTKSSIFRRMLETAECKTLHSGSIPMPEMNHDQLTCLVEFLYSGYIPEEKMEQHGRALFTEADKYEIPLLRKICETYLSSAVNPSNVLEILELADMCSATALKETAINAILKYRDEVITSKKYKRFAMKNAHLSVEITEALLRDTKSGGPFNSKGFGSFSFGSGGSYSLRRGSE